MTYLAAVLATAAVLFIVIWLAAKNSPKRGALGESLNRQKEADEREAETSTGSDFLRRSLDKLR